MTARLLSGGLATVAAAGVLWWVGTLGGVAPMARELRATEMSVPPGSSRTRLADGRWLVIGGETSTGVGSVGAVWDQAEEAIVRSFPLHEPRTWHTATLLPNGDVLIVGGIGRNGEVLSSAEVFKPAAGVTETLEGFELPRAFHTATLLTDGRVLVAGGLGPERQLEPSSFIWDVHANAGASLPAVPRAFHQATLLGDGRVFVRDGISTEASALAAAEVFDPTIGQWSWLEPAELVAHPLSPGIAALSPEDGARDVSTAHPWVTVRFSRAFEPSTVNGTSVTLRAAGEPVSADVVPAEGILAFVVPRVALQPATRYELHTDGILTVDGASVPARTVRFTTAGVGHGGAADHLGDSSAPGSSVHATSTAALPAQPDVNQAPPDKVWVPTQEHRTRDWRVGPPASVLVAASLGLPPLRARPGVTALTGQVLRLDGWPLKNVVIRLGPYRTSTDATGRFLLADLGAGNHELIADGRPASSPKASYGVHTMGVSLPAGETTVLHHVLYMPALDVAHATPIPVPTTKDVVVTTPLVPGLEVHVPRGVILRDIDGQPVTSITITPVPLDRAPHPTPDDTEAIRYSVYVNLQPGGAHVESVSGGPAPPVRVIFPNYAGLPAGSEAIYATYESGGHEWAYGLGRVSAGGQQIVPDAGVGIYSFACAIVGNPSQAPPSWASPDSCVARAGDPVDLSTGLLLVDSTDIALPDVIPITLTRSYRPGDGISRPFGIGASHPYEMFLVGATSYDCSYINLILPDGGRIRYNRSSGTTCVSSVMAPHTATPGRFHGSTLTYVGARSGWGPGVPDVWAKGWDIKLRDGTALEFTFEQGATALPVLTAMRDRFGNRLEILRDPDNTHRVTKIIAPSGRSLTFTYEAGYDRIQQITDNIGRTCNYTYDAGRLASFVDPAGGVTTYTYDGASNRVKTIRTPRLNAECPTPCAQPPSLDVEYWPDGSVKKETLADGTSSFQFSYNFVSGRSTQTDVSDPRGFVRRVAINADGYCTSDTRAQGLPQARTTSYELQTGTNLVLSVTEPLILPGGQPRKTTYGYNANGQVTTVTQLAGTAAPATTTFTYEPKFNQLATVVDPLTHQLAFNFSPSDPLAKLSGVTDATGRTWTISLNAAGQLASLADPLGNTTAWAYSGADVVTVTDPAQRTTLIFADAVGRVRSVTDAVGGVAQFDYDALNRLTRLRDSGGSVIEYSYDPGGNLIATNDLRHTPVATTRYEYDSMNRMSRRTDPLNRSETFGYDGVGHLVNHTDRRGVIADFKYDAFDRQLCGGFGWLSGATDCTQTANYDSTVVSQYDDADRLTQATHSATGAVTRAFDGLDNISSEVTPQGSISYVYDAASRRRTMTVAGQPLVCYDYDDANRLTFVRSGSCAMAPSVIVQHDAAGRQSQLTLPNNTSIIHNYDAVSRIVGLQYRNESTGALLGALTYDYNAAGERIAVGGSWARTTLPAAVASAAYDAADELVSWNGLALPAGAHDENGNLTQDGTNTYGWNKSNQLGVINGVVSASFQYDAVGRRVGKTLGTTTRKFLYDGANPVQELDGTGAVVANVLTGLRVDEYFARIDSEGRRVLFADALGSTVALSDDNVSVQGYTYEPFGRATGVPPSGNPFQFTGRENDDATGLYYYRARYYAPTIGRFVSEDPIGFAGGFNMYEYARSSPVTFRDPLGLAVICTGFGGAGTFGGRGVAGSVLGCFDDRGNVGWFLCGSFIAGIGTGYVSGVESVRSDAETLEDFEGPAYGGTLGFGSGPGCAVTATIGSSSTLSFVGGLGVGGFGGGSVGGGCARFSSLRAAIGALRGHSRLLIGSGPRR